MECFKQKAHCPEFELFNISRCKYLLKRWNSKPWSDLRLLICNPNGFSTHEKQKHCITFGGDCMSRYAHCHRQCCSCIKLDIIHRAKVDVKVAQVDPPTLVHGPSVMDYAPSCLSPRRNEELLGSVFSENSQHTLNTNTHDAPNSLGTEQAVCSSCRSHSVVQTV